MVSGAWSTGLSLSGTLISGSKYVIRKQPDCISLLQQGLRKYFYRSWRNDLNGMMRGFI